MSGENRAKYRQEIQQTRQNEANVDGHIALQHRDHHRDLSRASKTSSVSPPPGFSASFRSRVQEDDSVLYNSSEAVRPSSVLEHLNLPNKDILFQRVNHSDYPHRSSFVQTSFSQTMWNSRSGLCPIPKTEQSKSYLANDAIVHHHVNPPVFNQTLSTGAPLDVAQPFFTSHDLAQLEGFDDTMQPHNKIDQASTIFYRARHDREDYYQSRKRPNGSIPILKMSQLLDSRCRSRSSRDFDPKLPTPDHERLLESDIDSKSIVDEKETSHPQWLTYCIKQMMFVSGETAEPSPETTWMIEEIVREQVLEMLKEATLLANRRGSKSISIVDLIFQIRHNPAKVSRLKTFLSWKDVRKNVKDSDDKAGGADADALDLEDGALPGANPSAPQKSSTNKKAKLVLPWEVQSYYNETVPEREDEEDEEEEEQNEATLARLASADERTKNMTKDEYVYWSDCRQASFTFRKGKRFREWAGFGTIIDSKPNDDVVDILGFLTFEIVQTLTEEALKVKSAEDLANKKANGLRGDNEASKKRKREGCTLFEMPEEGRTPVEPRHVREAFRRLQIVPTKYKFMRQGYAGVRTPLRMI